jgi:hypothetical protein
MVGRSGRLAPLSGPGLDVGLLTQHGETQRPLVYLLHSISHTQIFGGAASRVQWLEKRTHLMRLRGGNRAHYVTMADLAGLRLGMALSALPGHLIFIHGLFNLEFPSRE